MGGVREREMMISCREREKREGEERECEEREKGKARKGMDELNGWGLRYARNTQDGGRGDRPGGRYVTVPYRRSGGPFAGRWGKPKSRRMDATRASKWPCRKLQKGRRREMSLL